ncbi:hypothetical protein HYV86_01425 [Candidatus Woesearchaeota archaeon]|nr:hypothetical protein [Candidatus Woesearchaeota archaeon]
MVLGVEIVLLTYQNLRESNQDYATGFYYKDGCLWKPQLQVYVPHKLTPLLCSIKDTNDTGSNYPYLGGVFVGDGFGIKGEEISKTAGDVFIELAAQEQPPHLDILSRFETRVKSRIGQLRSTSTNFGSTTSLVTIHKEGYAELGNKGDSRIYLCREGEAYILTRDDSRMCDYIIKEEKCNIADALDFDNHDRDEVIIDGELWGTRGADGEVKSLSSVVTASLNHFQRFSLERRMFEVGAEQGYNAHTRRLTVKPGDIFALMVDGAIKPFQGKFGGYRRRSLLAEILANHSSLYNAAEEIVDLEFPFTQDNKTVALVKIVEKT